MSIFDTILLIVLSGFVFYGFLFGLIRTFGNLVGMVLGAILASHLYIPVSHWLSDIFFGYINLGKVFVFIILFSLLNRLIGFAFYLLDKTFNIISIIPFLKTFNRLGGAVLGFMTGGVFLGMILFVASKYSILNSMFGGWLSDSEMTPFLLKFVDLLLPLLPEFLKTIKTFI